MSSCLLFPAAVRRVWLGLSARLGLLRPSCRAGVAAGLRRLRKEVRTCDYSDVHVMWEMLSKPTSSGGDRRRATAGKDAAAAAATRRASRMGRKGAACSRLAAYCCAL